MKEILMFNLINNEQSTKCYMKKQHVKFLVNLKASLILVAVSYRDSAIQ